MAKSLLNLSGFFALRFSLVFLLFSSSAWGLQLKTLSTQELMKYAEIVVWGEVVQIEVHPVTGYRAAILESREVIRAPEQWRQLRDFKIVLENRYLRKDDLIERVQGAPELKVGDELFVFLDPLNPAEHTLRYQGNEAHTLFSLRGFQQGAYRIYADELGVRRAVAWNQLRMLSSVSDVDLKSQASGVRVKRALKSQTLPNAYRDLRLPVLESLFDEVRKTPWVSDRGTSRGRAE